MKFIRYICFITLIQFIAGCSSTPSPQLVSGYYYMTGGSNCESFRYSDDPSVKSIECYTSDKQYTGKISAMSDSDLQKYAYKKLKKDAENTNKKQEELASWDTDIYQGKTSHIETSLTSKTN